MAERTPLAIRYVSEGGDAHFGWSVRGVGQISNYQIPVFGPGSQQVIEARGESFAGAVHRQALIFFNDLSVDLNIPANHPYEFFEPDNDTPTFTGLLRTTG